MAGRRTVRQVRSFQWMRVHRDVPPLEQRRERADVVEVAVRQDNGGGGCITADEVLGSPANRLLVAPKPCVDEEPRSSVADDEHVHHHRAVEKNVLGHLLRIHHHCLQVLVSVQAPYPGRSRSAAASNGMATAFPSPSPCRTRHSAASRPVRGGAPLGCGDESNAGLACSNGRASDSVHPDRESTRSLMSAWSSLSRISHPTSTGPDHELFRQSSGCCSSQLVRDGVRARHQGEQRELDSRIRRSTAWWARQRRRIGARASASNSRKRPEATQHFYRRSVSILPAPRLVRSLTGRSLSASTKLMHQTTPSWSNSADCRVAKCSATSVQSNRRWRQFCDAARVTTSAHNRVLANALFVWRIPAEVAQHSASLEPQYVRRALQA